MTIAQNLAPITTRPTERSLLVPGGMKAKGRSRMRLRLARFHDLKSGCKSVFGVQRACVDYDCVPSGYERRDASCGVTCIAFLHLPQNAAMYSVDTARPQLLTPTFGANVRVGGDEQFEPCLGAHDSSNVASVKDRAGAPARRPGRKVLLKREKLCSDLSHGRNA